MDKQARRQTMRVSEIIERSYGVGYGIPSLFLSSLPLVPRRPTMAIEMDNDYTATGVEDLPLPSQLENLSKLLGEKPEALATGSEDLREAALRATKFIYDLGVLSIAFPIVNFSRLSI